jgi:hypothetical protein
MILAMFVTVRRPGVKGREDPTMPAGEVIRARLAGQLDSGNVHVGALVTMDVLDDLRIKGE